MTGAVHQAALPGLAGAQTYAPFPVWRDSTAEPVTWHPMPKKVVVKLWHRARDFERRTREPGKQDGALGRNGLAALHSLISTASTTPAGGLILPSARLPGWPPSASAARRGGWRP